MVRKTNLYGQKVKHIIMKKALSLALLFFFWFNSTDLAAQNMNNEELGKIIYVVADSLRGNSGNWQFVIRLKKRKYHTAFHVPNPVMNVTRGGGGGARSSASNTKIRMFVTLHELIPYRCQHHGPDRQWN